jgi:hypothetical protein
LKWNFLGYAEFCFSWICEACTYAESGSLVVAMDSKSINPVRRIARTLHVDKRSEKVNEFLSHTQFCYPLARVGYPAHWFASYREPLRSTIGISAVRTAIEYEYYENNCLTRSQRRGSSYFALMSYSATRPSISAWI